MKRGNNITLGRVAGIWLPAIVGTMFFALCSCSAGSGAGDSTAVIEDTLSVRVMEGEADLTGAALDYADSILNQMSVEEKVGMMFMPAVYSKSGEEDMDLMMRYARELHVGGLVLLKGDLESVAAIADTLRTLPGAGYFLGVDAENGLRMRFPDAPEFPWSLELGRLEDDQLLYEFGREISRECREAGINMVLGPVMDIVPGEGSHGLMRKRSLGSDPKRVADLALAYARGVEDGNVISVAKHFPGHGSSSADSHKRLGIIRSPRNVLDSIDLYPFRRYAEEGLSGIMVGHLSVAALDPELRPAVASSRIMNTLLREQLGFRGLILTDALNMEGAMGVKGYQAVLAGADIVIAPTNTEREINEMIKAAERGELPADIINDRCRRILFYKYIMGVNSKERIDPATVVDRVGSNADNIRDVLRRSKNSILYR